MALTEIKGKRSTQMPLMALEISIIFLEGHLAKLFKSLKYVHTI